MAGTLIRSSLCILLVWSFGALTARADDLCPQRSGSDPTDINGRILKLKGQKKYVVSDDVNQYRYELYICKETSSDETAVRQYIEDPNKKSQHSAGRFKGSQIRGGVDWFMITYPNGDKYNSHCDKTARKSDIMVTCDPDADRGTVKIIEEYVYNSTTKSEHNDCYYLFELNNKAACTIKPKSLSPGSILLIVVVLVTAVYLLLGFLYQRFIVGAKGMEQIPNYDFWVNLGNLQADGCNFICRCSRVRAPPRYKTMDDEIADDDEIKVDDDNLLPM